MVRSAPAPLALIAAVAVFSALAGEAQTQGSLPDQSYTPDLDLKIISPQLGASHHNQPHVINGYLFLGGNGVHEIWDIANPFAPTKLSELSSPHRFGEAESHTLSFAKYPDGSLYAVTISGRGVDLWDVTDAGAPELIRALELEGVDYGDSTSAVWGVFWQGDYIYVGGTNTGLHIVNAAVPSAASVVARIPTSEFGGIRAGPIFAIGNLLVIGTPKRGAGIATLDIGDPLAPGLLDVETFESKSYIGWFYGRHAYLLRPFRTLDVTTDPTDIQLLGSASLEKSEYMNFGDGILFLGGVRPEGGVYKYALGDPDAPEFLGHVAARDLDGVDDQFTVPIGNLLVMSDDQRDYGSVLAVHDLQRDTTPPEVLYVNPPPGATSQPITSRIGFSMSDQVELASVDASSLIVRPLAGEPLTGNWGLSHTVLSFWPDEPLAPDTTYEIVLPAGGVRDLVGNPIASEFRSVFSTGAEVSSPPCAISTTEAAEVGRAAVLRASGEGEGLEYEWDFGDGSESGRSSAPAVEHVFDAPGRYRVGLTVSAQGASRRCSAVQVVHRPLPATPPTRASSIVVDEQRRLVLAVNPDAGTLTALDADTLSRRFEIRVGLEPRAVALAPDGTAWVANQDSYDLSVVDPEVGRVVNTISLPYASMPHDVAFSPDGARAYVTLQATGQVAELDPASRCLLRVADLRADASSPVFPVRGLAVTPDSRDVLVARLISPSGRGEVYVLDAETLSLKKVIGLDVDPGPDSPQSGRGVPNYLRSIAVSPDGARAWIPAKKDNTSRGLARDGEALSTDNTVRTIAAQIDLISGTEIPAARLDLDDRDLAVAVAFSPSGDLAFVAAQGSNQVDVFDAYSGQLVAGLATSLAPSGLWVTSDGRLYIKNFLSRSVSAYDVTDILSGRDPAAHKLGEVTTVEHEPLSPQVLLGKQIFYNADDRRMSRDGYSACATCHLDGGQDGRVWDFTDRGEGLRNTITLRGRAGTGHGPLHWTGNFDEVQDFENDIRNHLGGFGFMRDEDFASATTSDPLGDSKAGLSEPLDALAAFVSSLDSYPRSPHREQDGTLTADAVAGKSIFERLDCGSCHRGPHMTDSASGVRHDVGTLGPTSGQRRGKELRGIDTPTLRGLWATGPYFHDGSAATLLEVLERPGHGNAASLSAEEKGQLVAYLLQLEGPERDAPLPALSRITSCQRPPESTVQGCGCRLSSGLSPASWPALALLVLGVLGILRPRRASRPVSA